MSRWWPGWRKGLKIIQPETVQRWRRQGLFSIWGYRARGRWRGGRPRINREIRDLIARMARENFLWGAPRIHGELLKLGYSVSQATVSRYMPDSRWPRYQSWRTFIRNQAAGIGLSELTRGHSVSDFLGIKARTWLRTARRRFVRCIHGPILQPRCPQAVWWLQWISPTSAWATPVAHPPARSSVTKSISGWHVALPIRERMTRTRAPPRYARASLLQRQRGTPVSVYTLKDAYPCGGLSFRRGPSVNRRSPISRHLRTTSIGSGFENTQVSGVPVAP